MLKLIGSRSVTLFWSTNRYNLLAKTLKVKAEKNSTSHICEVLFSLLGAKLIWSLQFYENPKHPPVHLNRVIE
ncbi:hypothetical protein SAMN05518855_100864 [Paenibacillus sp. CF384]|nr:hypothetical protein SAMN05518855_100864 [Paenibacillus sp. CF384]